MVVTRKMRRVIAVLAIIGVCIAAAVITVSVTGNDDANTGNDSNSDGSSQGEAAIVAQVRTLASQDPLVVVGLRVVQGATDDAARDRCNSNTSEAGFEWIIAGKNLNATTSASTTTTTESAFIYLCMHQVRTSRLSFSVNDSGVASVVRSVHVVQGDSCFSPLTRLYSPRPNVTICIESVVTATALRYGLYVSDLSATIEGNYYSSTPGWTTDPLDITLQKDPSLSATVYLATKRPHWSIAAMQVLSGVNATSDSLACSTSLGSEWDRAGFASLSNGSVNDILCLQHTFAPVTRVLSMVEIVPSPSQCSPGFNESLLLTPDKTLCGRYSNASTATSYIGELKLREVGAGNAAIWKANGFETLPIQAVGDTADIVLVYRTYVVASASSSSITTTTEAATPVSPPLQARATETGLSFKIVQLADLHFTGNSSFPCRNPPAEVIARGETCTEAYTTAFVNQVLDEEQPDFVVFTGDNIEVFDGNNFDSAIAAVVGPVEARKIPYAVVLGNHDDENGHSREKIAAAIIGRPYSYMQSGPSTVSGVGNYDLDLHAPTNGSWGAADSTVFRMYFLDSHAYPDTLRYPNVRSGYDWIKPDQVDYYHGRSIANRGIATNTSTPALPAIMFFHIPIPEYASVGSESHRSGEKHEVVTSPEINTNLFSALVEMDEIKATFVGHDHVNEFCYKRQGIQLCHGGGTGFAQAYGEANFARRARVIEWSTDNSNKRSIRSWKRHYGAAFATRQSEEVLFEEL